MKKYYFIILFVICTIFMFPTKVLGICQYENVAALKAIGSNINYDYKYIENGDHAIFDIRFTNLNNILYIHDVYSNKDYFPQANGEISVNNLIDGINYKFIVKTKSSLSGIDTNNIVMSEMPGIISTLNECGDLEINNIYINIPGYNKFYKDPLCSQNKNSKLCNKWFKNNYTYKQFKEKLSKENDIIADKIKKEKKDNNFFLIFFNKYYIPLCVLVLLFIAILIYALKTRKNKGFEGW